jgi:hypothetical protein
MPKITGLCFRALAATLLCALPIGSMAMPTRTAPGRPLVLPTPTPYSTCRQGNERVIKLGPALTPFALLAGSTITNVGNTLVTSAPLAVTGSVNDDLVGVSPGTAITGFYPPASDTDGPNAIYAAGFNPNAAVPMAAQSALAVAYNKAALRRPTASVAGDLSQVTMPGYPTGTLPPGVYHSTSTLGITAGNLTLDGRGHPYSVFLFQVGSSLTTTAGGGASGNIILTNGASPCNVFWQIGSSATLGGSTFYGDVFAFASVTLNATTFTGRALAMTGAVTIPVVTGTLITNPGGQ